MKRHLTIILPVIALSGCATNLEGLSKDERRAKLAAVEVRNERWAKIGEAAGMVLINLGTGWVQAKALESGSGFKK